MSTVKQKQTTDTREIPEVPENAGDFGEGSRLYGWEKEVRYGPTYVFLHDCGSRAAYYKQGKTDPKEVYYCPKCDVKSTISMSYGFEEVRIDG